MAIYNPTNLASLSQAVDLSETALGSALTIGATGVSLADSVTDQVVGFLNSRSNAPTVGLPVSVQVAGVVASAIAHGAVAAGEAVGPSATAGRLAPSPSTAAGALARVGIALTAAQAAGDTFTVRIV